MKDSLSSMQYSNFANNVNEDVENEQITSFELGYGYISNH